MNLTPVATTFGTTQRVCKINLMPTAQLGKLVLTLGKRSLRSQILRLELLAVAEIGNSNGNLKKIANCLTFNINYTTLLI